MFSSYQESLFLTGTRQHATCRGQTDVLRLIRADKTLVDRGRFAILAIGQQSFSTSQRGVRGGELSFLAGRLRLSQCLGSCRCCPCRSDWGSLAITRGSEQMACREERIVRQEAKAIWTYRCATGLCCGQANPCQLRTG